MNMWIAQPDTSDDDGSWEVVGEHRNDTPDLLIAYGLTEETARLIAAAPDMLAALKALTYPDGHILHDTGFCTAACAAVRVVIAKAEGKS
jgi:hypothetical protein